MVVSIPSPPPKAFGAAGLHRSTALAGRATRRCSNCWSVTSRSSSASIPNASRRPTATGPESVRGWRPIVSGTVAKFLRCGDLHEGFARVKCRACKHEFFVAFSCKQRCVCASRHQKRSLILSERLAAEVCAPVAHRQFVFTVPKRLRVFFRFDRALLGDMARLAWETVREVYRATLGRDDLICGRRFSMLARRL